MMSDDGPPFSGACLFWGTGQQRIGGYVKRECDLCRMKKTGVTPLQLATMTIGAGICVANIYYNQPLLKDMARDLQVDEQKIGLIPVLTQSGYALGLFFLTPLGDKVPRKKLMLYLLVLLIAACIGMALAQGMIAIYAMCLCVGAASVIAQVILPMAAGMDPVNKGKNVGIIFT